MKGVDRSIVPRLRRLRHRMFLAVYDNGLVDKERVEVHERSISNMLSMRDMGLSLPSDVEGAMVFTQRQVRASRPNWDLATSACASFS